MGVVFMGRLSILQVDKRFHTRTGTGLWGAPVLGVTFGLGWAPCIGPTFAAVQTLVFTGGAATFKAVVLTFAYCLGLGVPFLLVAYFAARGVNTTGWASTHKRGIQRAGGAMLILIGILILTGAWTVSWPGFRRATGLRTTNRDGVHMARTHTDAPALGITGMLRWAGRN